MDTSELRRALIELFPKLSVEPIEIVAPISWKYNCIAYAVGDVSQWWGTLEQEDYWPDYATRSERMESLIEVFAGLGYQRCEDSCPESGYQKVALYEEDGKWTHAAVQMPSGRWRSKMERGPLIEHLSPESLAGGVYGHPTTYMRRPVTGTATSA